MTQTAADTVTDLFIIGGGINGCGIARDATGHGLSVTLAEMNDLASATSSSSTKLFHGGLRYLEYFEFLEAVASLAVLRPDCLFEVSRAVPGIDVHSHWEKLLDPDLNRLSR